MCLHHREPLKCIIPPYISDKINDALNAKNKGDRTENRVAERRLRVKRQFISGLTAKQRVDIMPLLEDADDARKLHQKIYDAGQLPIIPGTLIWETGQSPKPKEQEVKEAIRGGEQTWKFYHDLFNRNSIDNKSMIIVQSLHYREDPRKVFDNAMWDSHSTMMIYGDGDGITTKSFTSDLDIIGHEMTHGVIDFEAGLEYKNQSGALNESVADVFGILVKQWTDKTQARKSNWLLGENVLIGKEYALRSLKAPGKAYTNHPVIGTDPQPATMNDFVQTTRDFGGVHINSGIPNHAFYVSSFELGGFAWEKTGKIWYAALTDKTVVKKKTNFAGFRKATLIKAAEIFGKNSLEQKAVQKGWDTVQVF